MSGLNRATIIGNVGKNPEIRQGKSGKKIAQFSVATSETWRDKETGEKRESTEWHRIVCLNEHLSEIVEKYVKKGSKVYVDGAIKTRSYEDNAGTTRYVTEIVLTAYRGEIQLLDVKDKNSADVPSEDSYGTTKTKEAPEAATQGFYDDEIPFD